MVAADTQNIIFGWLNLFEKYSHNHCELSFLAFSEKLQIPFLLNEWLKNLENVGVNQNSNIFFYSFLHFVQNKSLIFFPSHIHIFYFITNSLAKDWGWKIPKNWATAKHPLGSIRHQDFLTDKMIKKMRSNMQYCIRMITPVHLWYKEGIQERFHGYFSCSSK